MSEHIDESVNYGWVIEGAWSHIQTPDYWVGSSAWSQDHDRALRFARKQDAEQAAAMMLDGIRVRICEHGWTRSRLYTKRGERSRPANPNTQDLPLAADSAKGCADGAGCPTPRQGSEHG